jgi:hypothetical protein
MNFLKSITLLLIGFALGVVFYHPKTVRASGNSHVERITVNPGFGNSIDGNAVAISCVPDAGKSAVCYVVVQ